jgi:hypothetical protein
LIKSPNSHRVLKAHFLFIIPAQKRHQYP